MHLNRRRVAELWVFPHADKIPQRVVEVPRGLGIRQIQRCERRERKVNRWYHRQRGQHQESGTESKKQLALTPLSPALVRC